MSAQDGYIVEFTPVGSQVRVVAIDPETGREVTMIGARGITQEELAKLAVQKLKYVLAKEDK